jgi:hypothetical protein
MKKFSKVDTSNLPVEVWNSIGFKEVVKIRLIKKLDDGYYQYASVYKDEWHDCDLSHVVSIDECFATEEEAVYHKYQCKLFELGSHRLSEQKLIREVEELKARYYELNKISTAEYNKSLREARELEKSKKETFYRSQITVKKDNDDSILVWISGRSPSETVMLLKDDLPDDILEVLEKHPGDGKILHARVNLGVDNIEDLLFTDWEKD